MKNFPSYRQLDHKDCGPACLKIVLKFFGKDIALETIAELSQTTKAGTTLLGLSNAAEKLGLKSTGVRVNYKTLKEKIPLPCIAYWQQKHFVVIYKIENEKVYTSDPAYGLITYNKNEFLQNWAQSKQSQEGIVLTIETTSDFFHGASDEKPPTSSFSFLWPHLRKYKSLLIQLAFGLLAAAAIQLAFPFLTQSLVDNGIQNQNLNFIYLVLLAQLLLFLGRISLEVMRTYILMHIGARLQISLLSEFFIKLMKLPVSFFDTKVTGDIIQRLNDHKRIEGFLTVTTLNALFSLISFFVFASVLLFYDVLIFAVFLTGSVIFFGWILLFQRKRREYDYRLFSELTTEQTKVLEIIQGIQEIKLNSAERQKRWGWETVQAKIFNTEMKTLALEQYQAVGASFLNELKNILITVIAAKLVLDGDITLGMMLSISYITGQLNSPLLHMIDLFNSGQKAKISIERLRDIHGRKDEEDIDESSVHAFPEFGSDIAIDKVSFAYKTQTSNVLRELILRIPANKVTAIVGPSGSGKTTLMKLLLKIYEPLTGEVRIGNINLKDIPATQWRSQCGIVMQDGFVFNDTIANNIALGHAVVDKRKLRLSMRIADIEEFVDSLPLSIHTKIGADGAGLSIGQKQRILIARAVYKDPKFIFFDEATSSLDANTERNIMSNLATFFKSRTVLIIAHRLSTVKGADQIILLGKNGSVEVGNHESLLKTRGLYYDLVKNQLQLESINGN